MRHPRSLRIFSQTPNADNDAQNAEPEHSALNGSLAVDEIENKHVTSVEDLLNSADPSVSGGSDTEASKLDPSKSQDGDKGHTRTSSAVKKPATFKAVSVNKTFLASKGAAGSITPKIGDKTGASAGLSSQSGASAASATRPRLVAKTASALRDAAPRFSSVVNGGRPGAAPDASAVWNKNRREPLILVHLLQALANHGLSSTYSRAQEVYR